MTKPSPSAKPKGNFSPGSFAQLRSLTGEASGEPLRLLLTDIDEDPNQPRKAIGTEELEPLAATIRSHGVLQPIGVHPAVDGRYRLAFGARRLRASHIAGELDIPAIIVPDGQRNYASQVIENQQRTDLSNSDLAAAVDQLHSDGTSIEQIAVICNLKQHTVSAFRAVRKFPTFLTDRLDSTDVRALYELYRQWTKTPAELEAGMPETDVPVTITDARRIISSIAESTPASHGTSVATPASIDDRVDAPNNELLEPDKLPQKVHDQILPADREPMGLHDDADGAVQKPAAVKTSPERSEKRGVIVAIGEGEHGQLVIDRAPETAGWGLVRYPTGIEEVELRHLRIIAIG